MNGPNAGKQKTYPTHSHSTLRNPRRAPAAGRGHGSTSSDMTLIHAKNSMTTGEPSKRLPTTPTHVFSDPIPSRDSSQHSAEYSPMYPTMVLVPMDARTATSRAVMGARSRDACPSSALAMTRPRESSNTRRVPARSHAHPTTWVSATKTKLAGVWSTMKPWRKASPAVDMIANARSEA